MRAGEFWASFAGQLLAGLAPLIVVGIVALVIWRKIFGPQQTVADVVNKTIDSAASLPSGVVSAASSALRGESESTYITQEQARQLAQARLQLVLHGG